MKNYKFNRFSIGWVLASMAVFIIVELVLGGLVGRIVAGRYMSYSLDFTLRGLLNITSYFIGGIIIGIISPGLRVLEPAIGAVLSIFLMWIMTLFVPHMFFQFDTNKLMWGGCVAFVVAIVGAIIGESVTKQI